MSDCNDEPEADAAKSPGRQEGLHPRWTQDEAIAFACARDYLAELQAVYTTALDELMSQPDADATRIAWLRGELVLLRQQRRDLTVRDQAAVAEIGLPSKRGSPPRALAPKARQAVVATTRRRLIKLDFQRRVAHNPPAMHKVIHSEKLKQALQARGWTQKELATTLEVTGQAVTNWMKGVDFPRPDKLLKLATTLQLSFADLVVSSTKDQPVIAFRKKGGAKTTDAHVLKAIAMGSLLKPLVPFLSELRSLRVQIQSPTTHYEALQAVSSEVRTRIGLGGQAVLSYEHLIGEFEANGAVIVPVMWGEKQNHKNALHILLPQEKVTFIFLNLDTRLEDFKFWMAHELAHVYTPDLAGKDEGEDFADAMAGALLFPKSLAEAAYPQAARQSTPASEIRELQRHANAHSISLFSVFREINNYAKAHGLPVLRSKETDIHATRNSQRGRLVSESLFAPAPPEPAAYVAAAQNVFRSGFFPALQRMVKSKGTGAGYVQQIMDIPMQDAAALHGELSR